MEFFYKYFGRSNHISSMGEMHVKCPFPHKDIETGEIYLEQNPSAHININESIFHCKACGVGLSEPSFLAKVQGVSYGEALRFLNLEKEETDWSKWVDNLKNSPVKLKQLEDLGLHNMVDELQIGYRGDGFAFPVYMYGDILDIRTYDPSGNPKVKSEKHKQPLILPFDLWLDDERPTILNAGEKDMAITRAMGFNAITFTGGEGSFPKVLKGYFKGKKVYICYDNDQTGREASATVATLLKEAGAEPYVINGHYTVCTENGEDIHDFFMKYGKTAEDFQAILDQTEPFSESDYQKQKSVIYPLINIEDSVKGEYTKKVVSSRVVVSAIFEEVYKIPEVVKITKGKRISDRCQMDDGEERTWYLDDSNLKDLLYMCDNNIKEANIRKFVHSRLGTEKEENITYRVMSYTQVFKAVVTNDIEATIVDNSYNTRELVVYSTKGDLKTGERYRIFYETVAHPLQGQKAVGLIHKIEKSDIDLEKFQVTPQVLESLKCFQVQDGESVEAKMNENFERFKDIAGAETQKMIQLAVDLFYHTPLKFRFGRRVERAYLEPFILGETRTSKSQTAKKALETYQLGVFTSLKTATATALIGGLDKTLGKVKLGVLPRNHKGAVIFEEFSDAGKEYIKQLTDIRSSNMVRIHRVAGEVTAEAMVRMLTISNQAKTDGGSNRDLDNYPHGVKAVVELVGAIEDIARYDFFVMIESPKDGYTSPLADFDLEYEAYPTESYRNRVRWIWSRTEDQVKITREVAEYIVAKAEELNKNFDCHIKFFGPEAWKKLARIAIATASCVCSIDETGENLVVTNDHVDWAYNFLLQCYDNDTFKLREYVEERRRYTECDDLAINRLQGLYNQHSVVIDQLAMSTEMSQTQLRNISNMSMEDFSSFLNAMAKLYFFEYTSREKITPTPRFRKALNQIKNQYVSKVGEGGR